MFEQLLDNRTSQFYALCKQYKVAKMFVFGSFAKGNTNAQSDVDILVELNEPDPLERGELLMQLWDALEAFFKRKVDLLTPSSLRNPYLIKSIEESKQLVFDGKGA